MKTRNFILTALLAAFCLPAVLADTPALINYQGRLTAADGTPQSGDKAFTLNIWNSATGGTSLYQEDIGQVTLDDNGIYSFQFGARGDNSENLAAALQNNSEHWIELSVDNDVLSPRQRILAVPFALNAGKAETANRAEKVGDEEGNVEIDGNANVDKNLIVNGDSNMNGRLNVDGDVTMGRDVYVNGNSQVNGNSTVTGNNLVRGDSFVDGVGRFLKNVLIERDLEVVGNSRVVGNSTIKGNSDIDGRLYVDGATTLGSTLGVTGSATLSSTLNVIGASTFSGSVMIANNAAIQQNLDVTGNAKVSGSLDADKLNANRIYIQGDNGETTIDGQNNILRGDSILDGKLNVAGATVIDGPLTLQSDITEPKHATSKEYVDNLAVALSVTANNQYNENRARINVTRQILEVETDENRARIEVGDADNRQRIEVARAESLDQYDDNRQRIEAAQQSLQAKPAARVASLANVDLQNASPEIDGVTLAAGDRVLLAGQTSAAENGLYVADANGALTRAGDFDSANEMDGGAHLFIQEGSQAGQGYVLADLGENFELGTGELAFSRFTVDPSQSLALGDDLNVAGNAQVSGSLDADKLNANRIYIQGDNGEISFDGDINRISGHHTEFHGHRAVFSNNYTIFDNDFIDVLGDANFKSQVRLEGPITDPKHATSKEYVDALSARAAARVAALAYVDLQNASPVIDGVTLAAGDRVLLAAQTNAAENGLYVADANGALTRAGDFDSANEIDGGAHLFIQEGSQAGQGYVLADLGENFELGTGELSFSRFTVDPTQSLALGDDLNVAGNAQVSGSLDADKLNANRIYIQGDNGEISFDGDINRISGHHTEFHGHRAVFSNNYTIFDNDFIDVLGDANFKSQVRLEGPITDPKHATSKEYVDALSARAAARVAALAYVDLQNASPVIDGVTLAAGDRVLLAAQTNAAENGLYVADANGALTRAGDFDSANEIDGGAHLFIQEGSQAGQGYVLADLGENFELGTGELSFSRFTVDPTQSLALGDDLNVAGNAQVSGSLDADKLNANRIYIQGDNGEISFDGDINRISGHHTEFHGHRAVFSNNYTIFDNDFIDVLGDANFKSQVRLEGPITDPKHATSKEYVDALSARAAARVAALAYVDLQNASPVIDGVTLAAGDRVLLAAQTNAAENGLYVADANGALTRAGDFDSANEIDGGAHLFIQEGSQAGQGYVLADLGENFELGTGELSFSRFTVDPTQSLALGDDLNVAGNAQVSGSLDADKLNANRIYIQGDNGEISFDGDINRISGHHTEFHGHRAVFSNNYTIFDNDFIDVLGDANFKSQVRLEGPITDPKHATSKEYVDALSARAAARVAALAYVDLQNASPVIDGVTLAAGDRVLLAAQTNAAENGLYVADANGALTRAGDFDSANEIDGGAHLFIQEGSQAGQGYVLADLGENFELGTGELSFSRFTVDTSQSLALGKDLNVTGDTNVAGSQTVTGNSTIGGNLTAGDITTQNIRTQQTHNLAIDSSGPLDLNSSAGPINIGNDAVAQNINIAPGHQHAPSPLAT